MSDDLILFGSGLDQSLPTEKEFEWVREKVDRTVIKAIQDRDLDKATDLLLSLIKIAKVANKEMSRILFQFKENWAVFESEEPFEEWALRTTGYHPHTIERYIRIEALLVNPAIPLEVRTELADRNLTELFPVANMIDQGYEPTEDQWQDVLRQPDPKSIGAAVREIKGTEPRPTALVIRIDEQGTIWVTKDNVKKFVGSLELADDTPIVQQAIERIIKNTGMLR